jgi:hypothetical protein
LGVGFVYVSQSFKLSSANNSLGIILQYFRLTHYRLGS